MRKLYGRLNNRLEENKMYCDEIKVGTGATIYLYSDRHAYEVTKVINQQHVFIRKMNAKRIDKNGLSNYQEYEFTSNLESPEIELIKRTNGLWFRVDEFSKEKWLKMAKEHRVSDNENVEYNYYKMMSGLTFKQLEKIEQNKIVKRYSKFGNISFGIMQQHFDYSF